MTSLWILSCLSTGVINIFYKNLFFYFPSSLKHTATNLVANGFDKTINFYFFSKVKEGEDCMASWFLSATALSCMLLYLALPRDKYYRFYHSCTLGVVFSQLKHLENLLALVVSLVKLFIIHGHF